ncbi:MAG: acetyltransferase [Bacteroidota bacterium]
MIEDIVIVGAGGLGREIATVIENINRDDKRWNLIGYYDDDPSKSSIGEHPILGNLEQLKKKQGQNVILALGKPLLKKKIIEFLKASNHSFPSIIHPGVIFGDRSTISLGMGNIITAGSILTTDIQIANFCLINLNTTIGHDVNLESFVSIMPGANIAGSVKIYEGAFLGSGCNLINRTTIGRWSKIGAGSVVISNIPEGSTAVGVPAKVIKLADGFF